MPDPMFILAVCAIFLLAGLVKGVIGMGLPAIAIGLLSLVMEPRMAIAVAMIPMILTNLWQAWRGPGALGAFRRHWIIMILMPVMVALTVWIAGRLSGAFIEIALGASILLFVGAEFAQLNPKISDRADPYAQIGFGLFGGILAGLTSIWAVSIAPYLQARGVQKEDFVGTTGLLIFLGSIPLMIGYLGQGHLRSDTALLGLIGLVPSMVGFRLGEVIRHKTSQEQFKTLFLIGFAAIALNLLRRGFW